MPTVVSLDIFSGVPNPSWELSEDEVREFQNLVQRVEQTTPLMPESLFAGLGYRGFRVTSTLERLEPEIYVGGGVIDQERFQLNRLDSSRSVEKFLLRTGARVLQSELQAEVEQSIEVFRSASLSQSGALQANVPPYNPGKWNSSASVQQTNNCYNYANDLITNTFAQPGRGSGAPMRTSDCVDAGRGAVSDGLSSISNPFNTPISGHNTALVIWPGRDFHWYRLDDNTEWSHKPGQTPARNTDNSGARISDPTSCNRGPYTAFCGWYHTDSTGVRIN